MQETTSCHRLLVDNKADDEILDILKLEKTLLESNKPLLKSQCEAMLLRTSTLLRLDSIASQNSTCTDNVTTIGPRVVRGKEFLKDAWELICGILSSALFKRPSYLVKSRVPLIVAVFRNLLFGLTCASDQTLYDGSGEKITHLRSQMKGFDLTLQDLETMSHNLDRCLDLIRGDKLKEDFARVAPYMIADILEAGFAGRVTVIQTVKNNLLSGMFKVC